MSQSFDDFDLNPALSRALAEMGFTRPTTIQQMVLEPALDGRDILASAPTGTGKTAAFLLPAMQHLLDFPRRKPGPCRMLILTPTRELALQVSAHAKALAVHTHLSIETIIGGVSHEEQLPALTKTTDIVVATPGRLLEYIEKEEFESHDIEVLVLDEADRMLDMGFIKDVNRIVEEARYRKHTMLFSATLEGAGLEKFASEILKDPVELHAEPPLEKPRATCRMRESIRPMKKVKPSSRATPTPLFLLRSIPQKNANEMPRNSRKAMNGLPAKNENCICTPRSAPATVGTIVSASSM